MDRVESPLIVGFVADLLFAVKIEDVANRLGYRVEWIERQDQLGPPDPDLPKRVLGEPLRGPAAALLDRLTLSRPALLIFDLGNPSIPWREWVALIKSVPATRRIPVLCYGAHVEGNSLKEAKGRGAEGVVARSRFSAALPELIQKYALLPDRPAIALACQAPLSALALKGLEEFNHGAYFEAHEYLESAWNEDQTAGRDLYIGILQVAVAYLHITRQNYNGAMKLFLRMRQWLEPLPDVCRGVDVAQLRQDAAAAHAALKELGPDQISRFDRRLLKPVVYREEPV